MYSSFVVIFCQLITQDSIAIEVMYMQEGNYQQMCLCDTDCSIQRSLPRLQSTNGIPMLRLSMIPSPHVGRSIQKPRRTRSVSHRYLFLKYLGIQVKDLVDLMQVFQIPGGQNPPVGVWVGSRSDILSCKYLGIPIQVIYNWICELS
jgi:hypothetical protein